MNQDHDPLKLSEELLYSVKVKKENTDLLENLTKLNLDGLIAHLDNDPKKLVFWINCYNAYYQILRQTHSVEKKKIYKVSDIHIAGETFSLDEIEHGILRRNTAKYSLGLLSNPFSRSVIKDLMVDKIDYRIHFALNCGAKSCPPIAFYNLAGIEDQLNLATQSFLESESVFDKEKKVLTTTALFQWFKFDFGGLDGIKTIYKKQLGMDINDYKIKYSDYSWEDALENFVE